MDALLIDALGRDASALATMERQLLLSRLLARLAHEIRNPLSALDVHVQLLEEDLLRVTPPVAPQITGRLAIIQSELHRLDAIVRQFLNLAAPTPAHLQPLDLAEVVQHVTQLLGPVAAERKIEIETRLPDDLPCLQADAGQLKQALVNLVLNAIQAIEQQGRVAITVRWEEPRAVLAIEVGDTGPGIDPGKRLAIFEPFFTTKAEGSGLGLWIVQQIAVAHGGSIAAANAAAGGALFTLRLPRQPTPPRP